MAAPGTPSPRLPFALSTNSNHVPGQCGCRKVAETALLVTARLVSDSYSYSEQTGGAGYRWSEERPPDQACYGARASTVGLWRPSAGGRVGAGVAIAGAARRAVWGAVGAVGARTGKGVGVGVR